MSTIIAPAVPQHMRALELANERRLAKAAIKRAIRGLPTIDGAMRACAILADPPEEAHSLRLTALLASIHRFGTGRAERVLRRAGVTPHRGRAFVPQLTLRERDRVADALKVNVGIMPPPRPAAAAVPARPKPARQRRLSEPPDPVLVGRQGLHWLVGRVHDLVWRSAETGLTEQQLARITGRGRDDVAEACGRLLEDGSFVLRPDGTYYRPDPRA